MKNSRTVRASLSVALVVVFAGVFYEVKDAMTNEEDQTTPSLMNTRKISGGSTSYVYRADVRDPFRLTVPAAKPRSSQKHDVTPRPSTPPPYTLNGTITNGRGKLAVIESGEGEIFFLSEGDFLNGLAIRRIDKDSVHFSYGGRKGSWGVR